MVGGVLQRDEIDILGGDEDAAAGLTPEPLSTKSACATIWTSPTAETKEGAMVVELSVLECEEPVSPHQDGCSLLELCE